MPCHEKVLAAAKNIVFVKHLNEFTVQEVQVLMAQENAKFSPTTIDTDDHDVAPMHPITMLSPILILKESVADSIRFGILIVS